VLLLPDVLLAKDEAETFEEFLSFYIFYSSPSSISFLLDFYSLALESVSNNKFLPYFYYLTKE
jgi:hypothetical protein